MARINPLLPLMLFQLLWQVNGSKHIYKYINGRNAVLVNNGNVPPMVQNIPPQIAIPVNAPVQVAEANNDEGPNMGIFPLPKENTINMGIFPLPRAKISPSLEKKPPRALNNTNNPKSMSNSNVPRQKSNKANQALKSTVKTNKRKPGKLFFKKDFTSRKDGEDSDKNGYYYNFVTDYMLGVMYASNDNRVETWDRIFPDPLFGNGLTWFELIAVKTGSLVIRINSNGDLLVYNSLGENLTARLAEVVIISGGRFIRVPKLDFDSKPEETPYISHRYKKAGELKKNLEPIMPVLRTYTLNVGDKVVIIPTPIITKVEEKKDLILELVSSGKSIHEYLMEIWENELKSNKRLIPTDYVLTVATINRAK